jgi:hypothetical protein
MTGCDVFKHFAQGEKIVGAEASEILLEATFQALIVEMLWCFLISKLESQKGG